MLSVPPHVTQATTPRPYILQTTKCTYNTACISWMRTHPAQRITVDKVAELFQEAYLKAMESAVSAFRCTSIIPFNPNILPITEFLHDPRELLAASNKLTASTMTNSLYISHDLVPAIPSTIDFSTTPVASTPIASAVKHSTVVGTIVTTPTSHILH